MSPANANIPDDRMRNESGLIGGSPRIHARVTGLVGLAMLASGSFAGYVATRLIAADDLAVTAQNLAASELLFRFGVFGSLIMMITWLAYALLLFQLLAPVGRNLALCMLSLVLVSVPIYMLNQVNLVAVQTAVSLDIPGLLPLLLGLHATGNTFASIFFGLWLIPLGLLVYQSGFLPRLLGVLLVLGSLGYLVLFAQAFFFPGLERSLWNNPLLLLTHASELALLFWLLFKGVDTGTASIGS